jgi:hypothetical protein
MENKYKKVLTEFNNKKTIKFAIEKEQRKSFNILDLTIHHKNKAKIFKIPEDGLLPKIFSL